MSCRRNCTSMRSGRRGWIRRSRLISLLATIIDAEPIAQQEGLAADRLPEGLSLLVPDGRRQLELVDVVGAEPVACCGDEGPADATPPGGTGDGDLGDEAHLAHSVDRRVLGEPAETKASGPAAELRHQQEAVVAPQHVVGEAAPAHE